MRYTLSQGDDTRTTLVVDTCAQIDDAALASVKRFMLDHACPSGLLFDGDQCILLRDGFASTGADSILEEVRIPAASLLATLGSSNVGSLDVRVGRWLALLAASWNTAVPTEPATAHELVYDVVPAAASAKIHAWAIAA